jgi:putative addiction module killer protein
MHKELRFFRTNNGKEPFSEWLSSLKDTVVRAQIENRLNRLMLWHYGDYKSMGDGLYELRIHYGGGYRVYFAEYEQTVILLLIGGSKRSQERDIVKAKKYWREFQENLL